MKDAPFTMRQMVEAGMHFGHTTRRCNPKMLPWIFGQRNGVHIIDLEQSARLLREALRAVSTVVANGGKVLIVGTKTQAQNIVAETALACGQYYINRRWLGGTLTNWQTVSKSIDSLKILDERLEKDDALEGLTKREKLSLTRRRDKIERALGGIREMSTLPDLMFVIDTNKEATAVKEAHNLSIPIAAILDSNSNPDGIAYPIPGNDDAARSLAFYLSLLSQAALSGHEVVLARGNQKPEQEAALADDKEKDKDKDKGKDAKRDNTRRDAPGGNRRDARRDNTRRDARRDAPGGNRRDDRRAKPKGDGVETTRAETSEKEGEKKPITVVKKKPKVTKSDQNQKTEALEAQSKTTDKAAGKTTDKAAGKASDAKKQEKKDNDTTKDTTKDV